MIFYCIYHEFCVIYIISDWIESYLTEQALNVDGFGALVEFIRVV
jgi:hypothetical protein